MAFLISLSQFSLSHLCFLFLLLNINCARVLVWESVFGRPLLWIALMHCFEKSWSKEIHLILFPKLNNFTNFFFTVKFYISNVLNNIIPEWLWFLELSERGIFNSLSHEGAHRFPFTAHFCLQVGTLIKNLKVTALKGTLEFSCPIFSMEKLRPRVVHCRLVQSSEIYKQCAEIKG